MAKKDPRIDAYITKAATFAQPILKHLRKVVHAGCPDVEETVKWSMPHFDYKGPMCAMAAFKAHATFGFWKASLVFEGNKVVDEKAMGQFGCLRTVADLPEDKVLIEYVRKAVALNDAGLKVPGRSKPAKKPPLEMPDDFAAALKKNAKAGKTFHEFTPGKQREYVEWVTEAKREETRRQRLATSIEGLAEGKPYHWKYQPK